MKVWVDDTNEPAPGFDLWCRTIHKALDALRTGTVEDISLGGKIGLEVAMWIENAAWRKSIGPVRWQVHGGAGLDPGNARASMQNAEVYWGIRTIDYSHLIRDHAPRTP